MAESTEAIENHPTPMDHREGDLADDFEQNTCRDVQDFRISKGNNLKNSKLGI
jgi:hypothetical protein